MSSGEEKGDGSLPPARLPELSDAIFAEGGWLCERLGLEHRAQQERMAATVSRAFAANEPVLFEAGTGVGKSLAYLAPGIITAFETKRPLLVATHTKALQEQVRVKDLGLCRRLFGSVPELERYGAFKAAKLVGRGNYLCTTRLAQAINTKTELFPGDDTAELERIVKWSLETGEGLLEELNPPPRGEVWDWVNADSSTCNRKNCEKGDCFYWKAKAAIREANVLILNHSLLFSLLGAGLSPGKQNRGVLYADDFVVLDEAHRVPEVATDYFGDTLSSYGYNRVLRQLYSKRGKRARGLLARFGGSREGRLVEDAAAAGEEFFADVRQRFLLKRDLVRLHQPGWAEPRYLATLGRLVDRVAAIVQGTDDEYARHELGDARRKLLAYRDGLGHCLELREEDHVYWLEKTGRRGQNVTIRSAPLDVADYLRECLFERKTSVVMTSATLDAGSGMEKFAAKVGAGHEPAFAVDSPFDFERNLRVFVAADAPAPARQPSRAGIGYLADMVGYCAGRVQGGTLALFTSYAELDKVARTLERAWKESGRPFYQQGQGPSRNALLDAFAAAGNGLLLGTESFWTGVDIPGPALSQVILARLPFENPTHPVAEARAEWIRKNGGNPFTEMTVPDAVIKFRQGLGRLIRSRSDRGTLTILDSRVLNKPYGKAFLSVLPNPRYTRLTLENRTSVFEPVEAGAGGSAQA